MPMVPWLRNPEDRAMQAEVGLEKIQKWPGGKKEKQHVETIFQKFEQRKQGQNLEGSEEIN